MPLEGGTGLLITAREITGQVAREAALAAAGEGDDRVVEEIFSRVGVALCLIDARGRVLRANDEWLALSGRATATLEHAVEQLFPGGSVGLRDRVLCGETIAFPPHETTVEGRRVWYEGRLAPVRLRRGTGILVTASDVSARHRAEERLREAERRLRALTEANLTGVMTADLAGRITSANDYCLDLLGIARADVDAGRVRWDAHTPPEWGRRRSARRRGGAHHRACRAVREGVRA